MKFSLCIGGLRYDIDCLTERFYEKHAKMFVCLHDEGAYAITVDEGDLQASPYYDDKLTVYENETVYILDRVIKHCLGYNRMIIHGAAICYCGGGYLFLAPSGTGKTTHIGLWGKYLDGVEVINGDKPMLVFGEGITVCGTPWNGKECLGGNLSAPLKAIVVIRQGTSNSFERLEAKDCVVSLLKQCFCVTDKECGPKVIGYIGKIANSVPMFSLECDVSKEAFDACYGGLLESCGDFLRLE